MSKSRWITGAVAACVLALAVPATSSAVGYTGTATLAPIGTGSYLLTVTNTGIQMPMFVAFATGGSKNVVSDNRCNGTVLNDAVTCLDPIDVGVVVHVCYSGSPVTVVEPGAYPPDIPVTSAPATTCPLAGFTATAPVTPVTPVTPTTPAAPTPAPTPGPTTPATTPAKSPLKSGHSWKAALCTSTYKSWKSKHKHATAKQRRAEQTKLKTQHGCKASALK